MATRLPGTQGASTFTYWGGTDLGADDGAKDGTQKRLSRPPVRATSPSQPRRRTVWGPKSRAGFMAKPVKGPREAPITAIRIPMSRAAAKPLGRRCCCHQCHDAQHQDGGDHHLDRESLHVGEQGIGVGERCPAVPRLSTLPRTTLWVSSHWVNRLL